MKTYDLENARVTVAVGEQTIGIEFLLWNYFTYNEFMEAVKEAFNDMEGNNKYVILSTNNELPERISIFEKVKEYWGLLPYYENAVEKDLTKPFWAYYQNYTGRSMHNWKDYYQGEFKSEEDFSKYYLDNFIMDEYKNLPDIITTNINYSMVWEDLRCEYTFIDGFVFRI